MNAVTIVGVVSAFGLVFLWLLALCVEKGVYPFRRVRHGFSCLPAWEKALLSIFVGVWIAFASVKDGTNGVSQVEGGTNAVTQVEGTNTVVQTDDGAGTNGIGTVGVPLMLGLLDHPNFTQGQLPSITDNDITLGWRMAATTGADPLAVPTANAVTNLDWRDYGGLSDSLRIKPEGWRFPYGDKTTTGLTVFENGDFRPNVKTHFFPQPFDANLSLLPRKNWGLLPDGGESVFWHEQTASNSLVLTWHNALYNRDVSCPTNFQAELFADGRFDYRYPDRTVQYAPVFPFDWDGDGLENSVDPEPLVPGPDTHGSNAEWYNRVCGTVFTATQGAEGVELAPRAGDVNTNAYYFVDVVAESLAPVYFTADGDSDLGNLVIVAYAGETNHVPLLIGLEYAVTSSVSFSVSCANESVVLKRSLGGAGFSVKWPVSFSFLPCGDSGYAVSVQPSSLNGVFSWTEGCCLASSSNVVAFTCSEGCSCSGCSAGGTYSYCGASLPFSGGGCGCGGSGIGPGHSGTNSVMSELSLSMCLDHDVVLFENSYTNKPGEIVGRRSTFACVQLSYGNASDGEASVMLTIPKGMDEIRLHEDGTNGNVVTSWHVNLPAGVSGSKVFYAEGVKKSTSLHGVGLRAMIFGSAGMGVVNRDMTSTEVWLESTAPSVGNRHRHFFGVGEPVACQHFPTVVDVIWQSSIPDMIRQRSYGTYFDCPLTNVAFAIASSSGGVQLDHEIKLAEPSIICATNAVARNFELAKGRAGGAGMDLELYVLPAEVSFYGLALSEIPTCQGVHTGYFARAECAEGWYHTTNFLAGVWHNVENGNFFMYDSAYMGVELPGVDDDGVLVWDNPRKWEVGFMSWVIPVGWRERGEHPVVAPEIKRVSHVYDQSFLLTAEGSLTVRKLGYSTTRTTNDCITCIMEDR